MCLERIYYLGLFARTMQEKFHNEYGLGTLLFEMFAI